MPTRRFVLRQTLHAAAATAFAPLTFFAQQPTPQQSTHPGNAADEMTVNTAPRQEHFPPPDFGPPPAELPPEALAVRGRHALRAHARRHGLTAGAAVVVPLLSRDPALAKLIADQYEMLVPEGELKWRALRPTREFDFRLADALFAFAHQHKMQVRGHTFVWHNSVPDWLRQSPASENVRQLLVDHITTVMTRYKGRVHSWDVVNEAIFPADKQPGGLRKSFWYDAVGPDYIDLAFRTARSADPTAKLTYNDYGVELDNDDNAERRALILDLLRGMKARGVPLDAVGIQAHIKAASPFNIGRGLADYIAAIEAMGLEVYLTELDVNEDDVTSNEVSVRDAAVAQTYRDFLRVALASPAVKLLLTWGVSDRRTWLNDGPTHHRKQPNRPQRSLPFDPQYRPAPAFFALRDSFDERFKSSHDKQPSAGSPS